MIKSKERNFVYVVKLGNILKRFLQQSKMSRVLIDGE